MRDGLAWAPFTQAQQDSLNDYQRESGMHPFTCGGDNCREVLIAIPDGWRCPSPDCDYTQNWAHPWMADFSWKRAVWRP